MVMMNDTAAGAESAIRRKRGHAGHLLRLLGSGSPCQQCLNRDVSV